MTMPDAMEESSVSDRDKVKIVSEFLNLAPPGEFNEVFNDCRSLLNNDQLLKDATNETIAAYNMDQLTPSEVDGQSHKSLVSRYNHLGENRYYDLRSNVSFTFDHYKKQASEVEPYQHSSIETAALRMCLDEALLGYTMEHFRHGVCSVFDLSDNQINTFILCIEDHQFQANNYWNGRWRSVWTLSYEKGSSKATLQGEVKLQVHYYEDGNVLLNCNYDHEASVNVEDESPSVCAQVVQTIREAESHYQTSINDNYKSMDNKTFKALRRHLPLTRSKIDWQKILSYRVASEIANKQ